MAFIPEVNPASAYSVGMVLTSAIEAAAVANEASGSIDQKLRKAAEDSTGWKAAGPVCSRRIVAHRNEPCPCGSGKKFKQCHLGKIHANLDLQAKEARGE